nr:MAG TPA: YopX protein [Caudoviricetes sp.]
MEDRYLFKAKRIDNGEWVQGYLYGIWEKRYILWGMTNDIPDMIEVDPSTICQCTGLKDKNENLIWENDIVGLYNENKTKRYAVGSVEYGTCNCSCCDGVYGWYFTDNADIRESGRYEVVGSVFDNPELLESEG